ncbi:enoyl-CoA hydratase/isomerase family protein [Rhodococcus aetherivorans]
MVLPNLVAADEDTYSRVLCDQHDGVLRVTLNRTTALNAINATMAKRLQQLWSLVRDDASIHSIIVSAAGVEAFCMGFDAEDPPQPLSCGGNALGWEAFAISPKECGVDKHLIVTVNGIACRESFRFLRDADVVVASSNASFFEPPRFTPADDVSNREGGLPAGLRTICATNPTVHNPVTALQAHHAGLVHEVVPLASLRGTAERLAHRA